MPAVTVLSNPKRRTDGQHPFAHARIARIAYPHGRQVPGIDLEHLPVGGFVDADDLGLEFAPVGQLHRDLGRPIHHVRIGQDDAVGLDDEAP